MALNWQRLVAIGHTVLVALILLGLLVGIIFLLFIARTGPVN